MVVWVDAIAINQADISERNRRVSIMQDIYSGAEKTVISLDPTQSGTVARFLDLLKLLDDQPSLIACLQLDPLPDWFAESLETFCGLGYWERAWVTQEVMFSRRLHIVYQGCMLPYEVITRSWALLCDRLASELEASETGCIEHYSKLASFRDLTERFGPAALPRPGSAFAGEFITLNNWTELVSFKKSSNPRDIAFAYHSYFTPEIRDRIKVDYAAPVSRVWAAMTQLVIEQTASLQPILGLHKYERTQADLPSWVPQWSAADHASVTAVSLLHSPEKYAAGGNMPATCEFINGGENLLATGVEVGTADIVPQNPGFKSRPLTARGDVIAWFKDLTSSDVDDYFRLMHCQFGVGSTESPNLDVFMDAFAVGEGREDWQVDECLAGRGHLIPDIDDVIPLAMHHFGRSMFSYLNSQVSSQKGQLRYGLGPGDLLPGDKIWVLQGCSVPIAVRKTGQNGTSVLLGEAYIPGCMMGEALRALKRTRAS